MTFPVASLKWHGQILGGSTPTADDRNWGSDVNWLTPTDISPSHGGEVGLSVRRLTERGLASSSARVAPAGSIVVTTRAPIGKVARTTLPSATNQGCRTIVPGPDLDARFLRYQLQCRTAELQSMGFGSTFLELSGAALGNVHISIPPIREQREIADVLDRECVRIDELRVELDALDDSIRKAESRLIDDLLPDEPRVRLGWLAEVRTGLTLGAKYSGDLEERPYLRVANVLADRIDLSEVKTVAVPASTAAAAELMVGDVLMTEGGDMDKLGRGAVWRGEIVGCLHQNHVFAVRPGPDLVADYLALVVRSAMARAYFESTAVRSTNLASTNSSKVRSFRFPAPRRADQQRIVDAFNQRSIVLSEAAAELRAFRETLAEYRDALITEAVTGKLPVAA